MKKTIRRTLAAVLSLCFLLCCATTTYAADDEWGVIPEGYVLYMPSPQSTVRAGGTSGATNRQQNSLSDPGEEPCSNPPVLSIPESKAENDPVPENNENSKCAYTLEEFAAVHLEEVNRIREEHGLPALETDPTLTEMANERVREYRMGHKRAGGSEWYTIFEEYDTGLRAAGENWISSGSNPYSQIDAFMRSDGHSANILNADAEYIGIGVKWNEEGTAISVVQLFAK